ncbi:hypothetical protein [Streptomyces humi]|uniref:hypothetical protein n=1 Tax=Streptomyces humi TaxID=1428620 RepID=UPI0006288DEC|nr:hypothetical protein [Streptomyces humi]
MSAAYATSGLAPATRAAGVEVTSCRRLRLTAYRLDRLSRPRSLELLDGVLAPGSHRVPLGGRAVRGGYPVVARSTDGVPVAATTR